MICCIGVYVVTQLTRDGRGFDLTEGQIQMKRSVNRISVTQSIKINAGCFFTHTHILNFMPHSCFAFSIYICIIQCTFVLVNVLTIEYLNGEIILLWCWNYIWIMYWILKIEIHIIIFLIFSSSSPSSYYYYYHRHHLHNHTHHHHHHHHYLSVTLIM